MSFFCCCAPVRCRQGRNRQSLTVFLLLALPIVKSLRLTLRRGWLLLLRLCNPSYIGVFCFSYLVFSVLMFLGFSLNDLMTVAAGDDSSDDDQDEGAASDWYSNTGCYNKAFNLYILRFMYCFVSTVSTLQGWAPHHTVSILQGTKMVTWNEQWSIDECSKKFLITKFIVNNSLS